MIPRHLQIAVVLMLAVVLVMAFYLRRMRGRFTETDARVADVRPVAPPVAGPTEQVTLYVAYDDTGVLHVQSARIPLPAGRQQRAQELLRALLGIYLDKTSPHPLAPGAEIRDVYMVDPGLAVIDTNPDFANGHRSGVLVEELTVASLVQTLAANIAGISRVKILVDGKERETLAGHASLSGFFDTSSVSRVSDQLAVAAQ
jgi:sporulation and spore germination protein